MPPRPLGFPGIFRAKCVDWKAKISGDLVQFLWCESLVGFDGWEYRFDDLTINLACEIGNGGHGQCAADCISDLGGLQAAPVS